MQNHSISCVRVTNSSTIFNFDIKAKMSFNILVWLGKEALADARKIYEGLVNEARVKSRTRTTYWRNDSAKLQDEVKNIFGRHVPEALKKLRRGDLRLRRR